MRPLLISTFDNVGGASRSAFRLHQGLRSVGLDSKMFVQCKTSDDPDVSSSVNSKVLRKARAKIDVLPSKMYRQRKMNTLFSSGVVPYFPMHKVDELNPDVINLHWACGGFIRPETLPKFSKPLVWTLHDMWAFTGGCHYDEKCGRYVNACGSCPILSSSREHDLSRWNWKRKKQSWQNLNFPIVTPSRWLAQAAQSSSLFKDRQIEVIPYGIDLNLFSNNDRDGTRKKLNLDFKKKYILFAAYGTDDPRKGFQFLGPALDKVKAAGQGEKIEILILGSKEKAPDGVFGLPSHSLGIVEEEEKLSQIFSAADVFVAPSIQDNLPNTVIEALACGVPCVAFNIGGMPDLIDHKENGYLAKPFEIDDLAQGILWVLNGEKSHQELADSARKKAEREYPLELQARRYQRLYESLTPR